jgi:hypothetical protein
MYKFVRHKSVLRLFHTELALDADVAFLGQLEYAVQWVLDELLDPRVACSLISVTTEKVLSPK